MHISPYSSGCGALIEHLQRANMSGDDSVGDATHGSSIAYCASKAGLNSLTKTLAKSMGANGVRMNAICPGLIDGDWGQQGWGDKWADAKAFAHQATPLAQITTPADIADGLISLVTGSDLLTGQIITLDGGFTL